MTIVGHEETPPIIYDIIDSQGLISLIKHKVYTRNHAIYYTAMVSPLIKNSSSWPGKQLRMSSRHSKDSKSTCERDMLSQASAIF